MRAVLSRDSIVLAGLLVCSSLLIFSAAGGSLWFDEVLSLQWAAKASNPWEIFSLYRHDNNHPLNTFWIYLVGVGQSERLYRALSMASGVIMPVVAYIISRRLCPQAWFVPVVLMAFAYPVILYSSEARGYAPAMALSIAAFAVILERPEPHLIWTPLFWLLGCLAILAHSTAVFPLAAMGGWSLLRFLPDWRQSVGRAFLLFMPVGLVFLGFFWFFLSKMMVAGGPDTGAIEVLSEFFGFWLGLPVSGPAGWVSVFLGAVLLAAALVYGDFPVQGARWFFALCLAGFPVLVLIASGQNFVHFRYLAVNLPFLALLVGCLAERWISNYPGWRKVVILLLALFICLQAPRIYSLVTIGRGDPPSAIARVVSESSRRVTVASNHEMLVGMVFEHYRKQLSEPNSVKYLMKHQAETMTPDWIVISHQEYPMDVQDREMEAFGGRFSIVETFPSAPASGSHWTLYKNVGL